MGAEFGPLPIAGADPTCFPDALLLVEDSLVALGPAAGTYDVTAKVVAPRVCEFTVGDSGTMIVFWDGPAPPAAVDPWS